MKLFEYFKKKVIELEDTKIPFYYFIVSFVFVFFLRCFLESFSSPGFRLGFNLFNYILPYYIFVVMGTIILFSFATKEKIEKVSKAVLTGFFVVILAPILDLLISKGEGFYMSYISLSSWKEVLSYFLTFFGPFFKGEGATPGIQIEIAIILFGSFLYMLMKNKSVIKSIIFVFLTYCLIFLSSILPFIAKILFIFPDSKNIELIIYFAILIFSIWIFYLHNKKYFIEILKDIRLTRVLHFELMFVLGIVLAVVLNSVSFNFSNIIIIKIFFIIIAILFALLFSIITNNLVDYDIDIITNKNRPSVAGTINKEHYKILSLIFLLFAFFYSIIVNFYVFFFVFLFVGNYFLYSMPPFRFKRLFFFSKLFIALNSLILVILGYIFIMKPLENELFSLGNLNFPSSIIIFFLIGFTFVINFIDIKDYEGDKAARIKTLPTVLGLKRSKLIIGFFFLITYSSVYFLIKETIVLIPLVITGCLEFYFINKKNYNENPVFWIYLIGLVLLFIYLFIVV